MCFDDAASAWYSDRRKFMTLAMKANIKKTATLLVCLINATDQH